MIDYLGQHGSTFLLANCNLASSHKPAPAMRWGQGSGWLLLAHALAARRLLAGWLP